MNSLSEPHSETDGPRGLNALLTSLAERYQLEMSQVFQQAISYPSISGQEADFVHYIAEWARSKGFEVDCWQGTEAQIAAYPESKARHLPLHGRPTALLRLPGTGRGRSVIFNAHSDVVTAPEPERWVADPWSGKTRGDTVYGRGACDTKGPLISALLAMYMLQQLPKRLAGDVLLELVPGEEDSVGLGTLTSVLRGYRADAAIILEPTESLPRCASRGGLRFEITVVGRAVHGTVKWLGEDAIQTMEEVLRILHEMEQAFSTQARDELFESSPLARPITVDQIRGGQWQGMVCDRCECAGYFELLPDDDRTLWERAFEEALRLRLAARGLRAEGLIVRFTESYAGHRTVPTHPLCVTAARAWQAGATAQAFIWSGFNSGCEAGLRARLHGTPTLVWGPGSLAHAHGINEQISWKQVLRVAQDLALFSYLWSGDIN